MPKSEAKAKPRRDWLAGAVPPYYGVICDRLGLEALAAGRVLARIQVQARTLLDDEERLTVPMTHLLDRTSLKGQAFIGRCRYCGREGLKMSAAREQCPQAPDQDRQILDALEGKP